MNSASGAVPLVRLTSSYFTSRICWTAFISSSNSFSICSFTFLPTLIYSSSVMFGVLAVLPVLTAFRVEKILADRRQFLFQGRIQFGNDLLLFGGLEGTFRLRDGRQGRIELNERIIHRAVL